MTLQDPAAQALEHVIEEQQFLVILQGKCGGFWSLLGTLLASSDSIWHKKHFFHLLSAGEDFESLLDDHGAGHNRTFSFLRELTASVRAFARAGYSMSHMAARFDTYMVLESLELSHYKELEGHIANVRGFIQESTVSVLKGLQKEAGSLGVQLERDRIIDHELEVVSVRQRLPHNLGEEEPSDEGAWIAEVASKFLVATELLEGPGVQRIADEHQRHEFLLNHFSEEHVRVFEATVHNLQSSYDTYTKNNSLASKDPRLPRLRGLASVVLHMLETATALTHFYERHERDIQGGEVERRLNELVSRSDVQERTLHHLLLPAAGVMLGGQELAKGLLVTYTSTRELVVEVPHGVVLHARPAALIVGIVSRHATPVELEVEGSRCNAGSILELLVCAGSHPNQNRFVFHGDKNPLKDIAALFEHGLGEEGFGELPDSLGYLTGK